MFSKFKRAALVALLFGAGSVGAFGADVDLKDGASNINTNEDGMYFVHNTDTADSEVKNANITDDIVIGSAPGNNSYYVIGASDDASATPNPIDLVKSEGTVNVQLHRITLNGNTLTVVNSDNQGTEGTKVVLSQLTATGGGTIDIRDSVGSTEGRYNQIYTNNLFANDINTITNINIGADSRLVVRNAANLGDRINNGVVNFNLGNDYEKGYAEFRNGMTLQQGRITGNGHIKGNVSIDGAAAIIDVTNNHQLYEGNLSVGANGGQIIVGNITSTDESNLEVTGRLTVHGAGGNGWVVVGGADAATMGTLKVNDIALTGNGVVNVGDYGKLIVGERGSTITSSINDGYINVGAEGEAVFNNDINLNNNSVITADGGKVIFGQNLTMHSGATVSIRNGGTVDVSSVGTIGSGTIFVSGTALSPYKYNSLVVGNGLTLGGASVIKYDATAASSDLTIERSDNGALGKLNIARAGTIDFSNAGGTSTLNVGDLAILGTANGNLYTGAFNAAEINTLSFTVARGANVRGRADVTTNVENRAMIQGKYDTAGVENFKRGLQVNAGGELAAGIGNATINIGDAAVRPANVLVNNGTLSSAVGNTLTLNNMHATHKSNLVFSGEKNVVRGTVIANGGAGFDINVDGDVDLVGNNTSLTGDTYSQTGGVVQSVNGRFQTVNVTGGRVSSITGYGSVFAASANFTNGVSFSNGATLRSVDTHTLNLQGNGLATTNFRMGPDTMLDLSEGDIKVDGFENVNVFGKIKLGFVGGQTTMLNTLGSYRTTLDLANIELSDNFVNGYDFNINGVRDYIAYDNTLVANPKRASHTVQNVFGDFLFRYVEGDGAWLESVNAKDIGDVGGVRESLSYKWGWKRTTHNFAANVSAVAQNIRNPALGAKPHATVAGNMNYNILRAFALGNDTYNFNFGGSNYSGSLDKGLHAAYNGSVAAGVTYVSQDVAREIITTLHGRVADIRDLKKNLNDGIGSTTALGSISVGECLNNQYLNRIWAGGLGLWQNADHRKGFDGYKYDGQGVILGYDRAFDSSGAVIGGLSVAYMKGDYEDKTAAGHDSEIKHYAADAYVTYNANSGFFATGMIGYNYSDNDIREARGGHWASQDYHTNTWRLGGKLGYDFAPADNFTMSPSVGVNFLHSRSSGHQMTVNNVNLLSYGKMNNHNVEIPVEMRMAYNINMGEQQDLTLMANGGYAYNLNDHGVSGSVGINDMNGVIPIRAAGRKLGHHAWTGGVGAKYRQGQWDVGVKYDYTGRGNFDGHRLMGTVGYSF